MEEQISSVVYKGDSYQVILDKHGIAWFVDPINNEIKSRTSIGQRDGYKIYNINDAKEAVLTMLKCSR